MISPEYEFHPFANAFPMLGEDALAKLAEDIKAQGLQVPIELYQGKILDGRNRYAACKRIGVVFQTRNFAARDDEHAIDHVASLNLHRRHLNEDQLAMAAQELANMPRGGDRRSEDFNGQNWPLKELETEAEAKAPVINLETAAKKVGVKRRQAKRARAVADAAPDLVEPVKKGEMTIRDAEVVVDIQKTAPDLANAVKEKKITVKEAKKEAGERAAKNGDKACNKILSVCGDWEWRTPEELVEETGSTPEEIKTALGWMVRPSRQGNFLCEKRREKKVFNYRFKVRGVMIPLEEVKQKLLPFIKALQTTNSQLAIDLQAVLDIWEAH